MREGSPVIIEERSEGLLPRLGAFLAVLAVSAALTLLAWAIWELSTALSVAVVLVAGGLALSFILHGVAAVVEAVGRARAHVIEAEGRAQAATGVRHSPALTHNRAGDTEAMLPPSPTAAGRPFVSYGTVPNENETNEGRDPWGALSQ